MGGKGVKGKGKERTGGDYAGKGWAGKAWNEKGSKGTESKGKGKSQNEEYDPAPVPPRPKKFLSKASALQQIPALDDEDDERAALSKKISWILRKGAERINVPITDDGFVKMSDMQKAEIMDDASEEKLWSVVEESNAQKLRYEVRESPEGKMVKAIPKAERKAIREGNAPAPANDVSKPWGEGRGDAVPSGPGDTPLSATAPTYTPSAAAKAAAASGTSSYSMPGYPYSYSGYPYSYGYTQQQQMAMYQQQMQMAMYQQQLAASQAAAAAGGKASSPAMTHSPGVVAGQYKGRIKSYNAEKGFGFLESAEAQAQFGRDVFVHKSNIGSLAPGAVVSFAINVNKSGMPQAHDLAVLAGGEAALTPMKGKGKGKGKDGKGKKAKDDKKDKDEKTDATKDEKSDAAQQKGNTEEQKEAAPAAAAP